MKPGKLDLIIYQGADFDLAMQWSSGGMGVDLTGYTAKLQVRRGVEGNVLLEMTDGDGITLGADGAITLHLDAADTSTLEYPGVYDLLLTGPSSTVRLLEGDVSISQAVTT